MLSDDNLVDISYNDNDGIVGEWENYQVKKHSLEILKPGTNAISTIEQYGDIIEVRGDGNCGIYSLQEGLKQFEEKTFESNAGDFRREIYDWISLNEQFCGTNLNFTNKKSKKNYIDKEIKGRIWNKNVDFSDGCSREYWVDASLHFPIVSRMFDVNIVWFDINQEMTSCIYWIQSPRGGIEQKHKAQKGYSDPKKLLKNGIVKDTIGIVFHNGHYQYLKIY